MQAAAWLQCGWHRWRRSAAHAKIVAFFAISSTTPPLPSSLPPPPTSSSPPSLQPIWLPFATLRPLPLMKWIPQTVLQISALQFHFSLPTSKFYNNGPSVSFYLKLANFRSAILATLHLILWLRYFILPLPADWTNLTSHPIFTCILITPGKYARSYPPTPSFQSVDFLPLTLNGGAENMEVHPSICSPIFSFFILQSIDPILQRVHRRLFAPVSQLL